VQIFQVAKEFYPGTSRNGAISHMLFSSKNGRGLAVSEWARLFCKAEFKPAIFRAFPVFRQAPFASCSKISQYVPKAFMTTVQRF
jgi:hypothetical protein